MTGWYVYRHVVTLDETNMVGNVYFAHFLHWQGHCRERFLADHAPAVLDQLRRGELTLVTVSCAMDYYEECFGLEEIEVRMSADGREGHRLSMHFEFLRAGREVARGRQTVACLRPTPAGPVPVDPPVDLRAALAAFAA
ncbi:acyl-CoA thioesterase [Micromonospora tulbaghiae]|uniref:acyl-CoA thioesterase n=1 Tax=Micromonospora tulbaghiae TaxID=479978 RepID=UPI0013B9A3C7|nr:acyl-CoA thioesterase [Micromonospora aurantiaca]